MGEINVLDSSVFNRIAAGEVVESPAAVVKELVENSIDANATSIRIEIALGGISSIKITDNGKGMSGSDLPIAFLPHATSKIKTLDDLNEISTLGFRGEALPSIASVAEVTATSRVENSETAYTIVYKNGKLESSFESGAAVGTCIEVKNIFENVPARKKFLKKTSAEGAKITSVVEKLILANSDIAITYIMDGKTVYDSKGDGVESAIYTVYGDMIENLQEVKSIMPDVTLKGYVSKPNFSKHNRNYQTLIVNGRVVENADISYYIYVCYQDYLMKRQYPAYVLYIDLPFDMVDVNVHPNKTEIKFSNLDKIKGQVFGAIKKALTSELLAPKEIVSDIGKSESKRFDSSLLFKDTGFSNTGISVSEKRFDGKVTLEEARSRVLSSEFPTTVLNVNEFGDGIIDANGTDAISEKPQNRSDNNNQSVQNKFDLKDSACGEIIVVGKLFNTYILVQKDDGLFMIDQHAAHERLLYDKYLECIENNTNAVQDLLLPYIFEVSHSERELIESSIDLLAQAGFIVSPFGGNRFSLSGVPSLCYDINLKEFVALLLEKIRDNKIGRTEFVKDAVAQSACKAAVKGKESLTNDEIESLIASITDSNAVLLCPHGRPTVIQIKKSEIEKWFKRIV